MGLRVRTERRRVMITIKARPLTRDAFEKYGTYINLLDNEALASRSISPANFFADVVPLDFGRTTLPTISVCHVKQQEKKVIRFLEAHQFTCEGLLPLDADIIIFVGTPMGKKFDVKNLEAFYVPKGTFVKLNPLIVHGTQFVVDQAEAHVVCMLPGRTFKNDMIAQPLEEEEAAAIVW